jgi:acyl-[acyl-carrier-protein]-phospholipid O-acyltransferase/long-chain-fatty-acid--[acyl-carrier-protein] ligase
MIRQIFRFLAWLAARVTVAGPVPASAPERLIVIANHQSFMDAVLLALRVPFQLTWIVHTTIAAKWHFRIVLKQVPHLVVDVANPLAMKAILHIIEQGKPVAIFPEGRITVTGSLMKVYDGLAFLVQRTGAQILPVNIDGAVYSYFTRHAKPFPKKIRPSIRMTFFPIETIPEMSAPTARARRHKISGYVHGLLEKMQVESKRPTTLFDAFLDAVELYGRNRPLLEDIRFKEESFGDVLRGALALGRLTSRFSAEGERVGVLMPNASPTAMLLFGLFAMRRVPAMLNYTAGLDGMQSAIDAATIRVIFTSRAFLEKAKLTEKIAKLQGARLIYLEDLRPQFRLFDKLWLILYALRFPRSVRRPGNPDDPAVVLFTSGSEGRPKGVVLSHRNILVNVAQARAKVEFSFKDKFLTALPVFHSFGLVAGLLTPLITGARVFLYPSPLHYRLVPEMAYDRECTVLFGTPTFLARYARFAHPYDFFSTRYVLSGAEKLGEQVRQVWMEKFGIRILEGYGVTECAPMIALNTPMAMRPGTVGRIVPGLEHKIEPVEGIERGGILHVKGANVMLGYLRAGKPGVLEPPSSIFGPGWYSSGDIVEIDEDGFVRIAGRVKRFAKIAGEMISLEVVEQIAVAASPNRGHASTTVTSERRGESIVLFTEDPELRREHLASAARERGLPELAVARQVIHIDRLPRLGSGKADYVQLKDMARERVPAS